MKLKLPYKCILCALILWSCKTNILKKNETPKQPNIVLFFVDDLGWADLGFRNPVFETPNIDQLAKSGINFNQAYIASPTCSPSRASLITGKHPARLKMVRHIPGGKKNGFDKFDRTDVEFNYLERDPAQFPSRNWLPLENVSYAEALANQGYYNLFLGKWHLGHEDFHPTKQGFDKQIGTSNDGHPKSYYPPYFKQKTIFPDTKETYLTDKLTNEAVDFISKYEKENPFLLNFSYYSVHSPHQGRKDLVKYFEEKGLEGKFANYAAMVKATDESVGKVLKAIKEKGIEKETVIIFLSDQGSYFENSPFRGGKMKETLFEGGSRVPFFLKWPGVTKPNSTNNSIVQSTDLFPTLVEIAGGDVSKYKDLDGVSLLSTIKQNDYLKREPVYGYRAYEDLYVSVRQDDWKLLAYRSSKIELFNITEDIKETTDLSKNNPEKVKELVKKLIEWEKEMKVESYSGVQ
jgi:arylsulfatase A-like enzyme